jgi:hypothetical protein
VKQKGRKLRRKKVYKTDTNSTEVLRSNEEGSILEVV